VSNADNDSLWDVAGIAAYLVLEPKTVRDVVVHREDFPKPVFPTGRPRVRRWVPEEVRRWAISMGRKIAA
jgi:hypothetical protein